MNYVSKILFKILLCVSAGSLYAGNPPTLSAVPTPGGDPQGGSWYTDEFGPLRSNYSMGDFVRYTVMPGKVVPANPVSGVKGQGLNLYYGMVNIPYAQDIYQSPSNTYNLYNFVGYLYAGYAALNINPVPLTVQNWLTTFRQSGQGQCQSGQQETGSGSLCFDNNPTGTYTIQLVDYSKTNPRAYLIPATGLTFNALGSSTQAIDQGQYFLGPNFGSGGYESMMSMTDDQLQAWRNHANASCAWNTNSNDGNYVLGIPFKTRILLNGAWNYGYAAPYGQFFGARLSHILGAVVTDVPPAANVVTMMPSNPNSPVPQMAILGTQTAFAGVSTPSTAHFGSLMNFLTDLPSHVSKVAQPKPPYKYLMNHFLPAVTRFATGGPLGTQSAATPLCSYQMNQTPSGSELIQINSSNVTSYDNGVIVTIQNNTGDQLTIHQVNPTSTPSKAKIGQLSNALTHNYFLHTASLIDTNAAAATIGTTATPATNAAVTNMIEITDQTAQSSMYIQVMNGAQLNTLVTNLQTAQAAAPVVPPATSPAITSYNQSTLVSPIATPATAPCLVMTNYNPTVAINTNVAIMCRIQSVNLTDFDQAPYFVTLQINKELQGYGYNQSIMQMNQISSTSSILYPSIVSIKTCSWLNPYALSQDQANQSISSIPLLMLPNSVWNSGFAGLQAHYGIWLMAYAAALTEFSFGGGNFGDTISVLQKAFKLFDTKSQPVPARVVIDASGNLASGQVVTLTPPGTKSQKSAAMSLMGSDVWDIGADTNQDIPILNLYPGTVQDVNGNTIPVPNQPGGAYVNFAVNFTVATSQQTPFAQNYGSPYANTMLFSLPLAQLTQGVLGTLTQTGAGTYKLVFIENQSAAEVQSLAQQVISNAVAFNTTNAVAITAGTVQAGTVFTLSQAISQILNGYGILGFQKVFLNSPVTAISINFLNNGNSAWNSSVSLPPSVFGFLNTAKSASFILTYNPSATNNNFVISFWQ